MGHYVFESDEGLTRTYLGAVEEAFDGLSIRRLSEQGVGPGWKCLDVGAGSGSIARWLSDRVGAGGQVVATDVDLRLLAGSEGANTRVVEHDLTRDRLPEAEYDLVHVRLLLILLPQRVRLLRRLVGALKPGGVLLLEDFDVVGAGGLVAPRQGDVDTFDRVLDACLAAMAAAGAEVRWGHKLYVELRRAGMRGVRSESHAEVWQGGSAGCALIRANFTQLRDRMLITGLVSPEEWERAVELLDDEEFAMRSFLMVGNSGLR